MYRLHGMGSQGIRILLVRITAFNKETKSAAEVEDTCDINLMLASSIITEAITMILVCCGKTCCAYYFSHAKCCQIVCRIEFPSVPSE